MNLNLRWSARSEVGLVREGNEDSGFAGARLLVVADGMGGMVAGDLASALTVQAMRQLDDAVADDVVAALRAAVLGANERLRVAVETDPGLEGMGTTVTALLWDGSILGLAHIGDSRGYLLRDGRLERLTHDHTFVQSLVDSGRITEAEARVHPHRSLLLRALDGRSEVDLDTARLEIVAGDRFLLCSDGLCGYVDDAAIAECLTVDDRDSAVDALVDLALRAGGPDNITCLVADAVDAGSPGDHLGDHPLAGTASTSAVAPTAVDDPDAGGGRGTRVTGPLRPAVLIGAAAIEPVLAPELVAALAAAGPRPGGRAAIAPPRGVAGERRRRGRPAAAGTTPSTGAGYPVITTADVDDEELRYAPLPPWRYRWIPRLLVVLLVIAGVGFGAQQAWAWSQRQYYVGASDGQVAIYRGLPEKLVGISLSSLYERENLTVTELPPYYRQRVQASLSAGNLAAAQSVVVMLQTIAVHCRAVATDQECLSGGPLTGLPSPSAGSSPARSTPASPAPTASRSASRPATSRPTSTKPTRKPSARATAPSKRPTPVRRPSKRAS